MYSIYHQSYTSSIQEVERFIESNKFDVDKTQMFDEIGMGPAKPSEGVTNRFHIDLYKNGVISRKKAHFQVYGIGNGRYELNIYIS